VRRLLSLVLLLVVGGSSAKGEKYKLHDLGPMIDSFSPEVGFNPVALNKFELVVGYIRNPPVAQDRHAAQRLRNGPLQDLGTLGGTPFESSEASAVNADGDVVGSSRRVFPGTPLAFVVSGGAMRGLGVLPGATESAALGINDLGEIVGTGDCVCQTAAEHHAVLFVSGAVHDLGTLPGGRIAAAVAINNRSQIVGTSDFLVDNRNGEHPFLYENGHMTDLGTLPGGFHFGYATDINDRGQIVGNTASNIANVRAFLYEAGEMKDLAGANGGITVALAINNRGVIVGWTEFTVNIGHAAIF